MKVVVFILCLFAMVHGQSQEKIGNDLDLQILCGFGAQTSKEVQAFKAIVDKSDTVTLRQKLFSASKLEQVLTAITLRYYQVNGSFRLTEDEQKKLREISKSNDRFSLCYTCTFQQAGKIKELFNQKNFTASYSIIESFLSNKP